MFKKKPQKLIVLKYAGHKEYEKDALRMSKKGYRVVSTTSFRKSFALFNADGYMVTYELIEE